MAVTMPGASLVTTADETVAAAAAAQAVEEIPESELCVLSLCCGIKP